jgi:hypothetical protein
VQAPCLLAAMPARRPGVLAGSVEALTDPDELLADTAANRLADDQQEYELVLVLARVLLDSFYQRLEERLLLVGAGHRVEPPPFLQAIDDGLGVLEVR